MTKKKIYAPIRFELQLNIDLTASSSIYGLKTRGQHKLD